MHFLFHRNHHERFHRGHRHSSPRDTQQNAQHFLIGRNVILFVVLHPWPINTWSSTLPSGIEKKWHIVPVRHFGDRIFGLSIRFRSIRMRRFQVVGTLSKKTDLGFEAGIKVRKLTLIPAFYCPIIIWFQRNSEFLGLKCMIPSLKETCRFPRSQFFFFFFF